MSKNFGKSTAIKIDINTASKEQLGRVLGLSSKDAEAITHYRDEHGKFKSWDDLKKVSEIDTNKLLAKKDQPHSRDFSENTGIGKADPVRRGIQFTIVPVDAGECSSRWSQTSATANHGTGIDDRSTSSSASVPRLQVLDAGGSVSCARTEG